VRTTEPRFHLPSGSPIGYTAGRFFDAGARPRAQGYSCRLDQRGRSFDIPGARGQKPTLNDGDLLKPGAIADTYWHLAHQDPSAWTMELEVRPFKEKFESRAHGLSHFGGLKIGFVM
jgi:hypothetical protein